MIAFARPLSRVFGVGVALGALQLAACASAPPKPPTVAPSSPEPAPAVVTMAPIPNPVEPAHERRVPVHAHTSSPDAKREKAASAPSPAPADTTAQPARDPVKAARLRTQGLEQLDRGEVTHAVALLTQASLLDPTNALIRHDLERAQRIARVVHGAR